MTNIQIQPTDIHSTIFYFNDLHGNTQGAQKIKTASDMFDTSVNTNQTDTFKFCAGDSYISQKPNGFIGMFLNSLNLDGMTLGNHEFDMGTKKLSAFMNNNLFKIFAANIDYKKGNNLEDDLAAKRLVKSDVIEKNGHKYGIVGATAADMTDTISIDSQIATQDVGFMNFEHSVKAIQAEVDKLKSEGIDKIILISHLGKDKDQKLAQVTDGIDIIVGGHSHNSINGIQQNENHFNSKSGEPVLVLQAGQNGDKYGILDVVFDKDGKIKQATNKLHSLKNTPYSTIVKHIEDTICGKVENIGELKTTLPKKTDNDEEHLLSCFVADSIRDKSGAQIVFYNKGCQKSDLKAGLITNRTISNILPYINHVSLYRFSEKDIIDAINATLNEPNGPHRIGNMQVSGMTYTIDKNHKLKDVYVLDGDKKIKLDENNPSNDKYYDVAIDSFFEGGPGDLKMLKAPDKKIKTYEWNNQVATIEYLKKISVNGQIDINPDGRIKIEK